MELSLPGFVGIPTMNSPVARMNRKYASASTVPQSSLVKGTVFACSESPAQAISRFPPSFMLTSSEIPSSPVVEFEPILPSSTSILAFVTIIVLSAAAAKVWANDVVPAKRTELAISKSRGEVKAYLDELQDSEKPFENSEAQNTTDISSMQVRSGDNRAFERWLFSDWLNSDKRTQKPAAIPVLKRAKWNSGDNPVLVASGLIMLCVLIASVTERVGVTLQSAL